MHTVKILSTGHWYVIKTISTDSYEFLQHEDNQEYHDSLKGELTLCFTLRAELTNSVIITCRQSQTIINIIGTNSNKVGDVSQCIYKHFGAFLEDRQTRFTMKLYWDSKM